MKKILFLILICIACYNSTILAGGKYVVVIDPGHGGKDTGAVRNKYQEKDINLGIALVLGELIEKNMPDVSVIYTRKEDAFVALDKRADIANKAKANLFISIHTNSTASKKTVATGADTYILGLSRTDENLEVAKRENSVILLEDDYTKKYEGFDPNSPESYIIFEFMSNKYRDQSLDFAGFVQRDFKKVAKRRDRGVREAGFLVLRKTSMPSVLIEVGFINNDEEAKFLTSKSGQRIMATSIFSGFKDYKRHLDKAQANDFKQSNAPKQVERVTTIKETVTTVVPSESQKTEKKIVTEKEIITTQKASTEPAKKIVVKEEIKEEYPINAPLTTKSTANQEKPVTVEKTITKQTVVSNNVIDAMETKDSETDEEQIKASVGTTYRVQFLYSTKRLKANAPEFKGLSPVKYFYESGYKYTFGETSNINEIEAIQAKVRQKFKDAFVLIDEPESKRKYLSLTEIPNNDNSSSKTKDNNNQKQSSIKINAVSSDIKPDQIEYRVQFLFSPVLLPSNSPKFKGLTPIDVYEDGGYKYTYGSTVSESDINNLEKEVRKIFKDAFIVQFKNGIRIK